MPDFAKNGPLVTGLEWEDPLHVNRLSISEERRLSLLITKIAALVNLRKLVLRPYFQDYELVCVKKYFLPNFQNKNLLVRCFGNLQYVQCGEFV